MSGKLVVQRDKTGGWSSACAIHPNEPSIQDILVAVAAVAPLYVYDLVAARRRSLVISRDRLEPADMVTSTDLSKKGNSPIKAVVFVGIDTVPSPSVIGEVEKLTGVKIVEVDTGSDLNVLIILSAKLAKKRAADLGGFARRLYDEAGQTA